MAHQTVKSLKSKALADLDAGKLPQALKKAQLGIKKFPKDSDYQAIAGFVLTEMKQYKRSIPHFVEASRMKPQDPQFAENLANALMQTDQMLRALTYAEQKLEQFPNNKELVRVIDEIQLKGSNWRSIIENVNERLKNKPDDAGLLAARSRAYGRIGFVDESAEDIGRAFALAPDDESIAYAMAITLHHSGDKSGSADILRSILEKNPKHVTALLQMAVVAAKDQTQSLIPLVEEAIAEQDHISSELEFAKAHLISRTEGLSAALPQFARANAAQHDNNPYLAAEEEEKFDKIVGLFPEGSPLINLEPDGGPLPIFVIGQPRSGTTLMEMMLSSAPDIAGCGELTLGADLSLPHVDDGLDFDEDAARTYATEFRKLMPPIPEGSTAFVDKMPHNYQRVGFLASAFPNARFINMMRDPRDVGLSKWIRRFPAGGMRYASNLTSIAHSANMYRRYLTHWNKVFGDRILTVAYEDLVADPEKHSRKVAEFCGIEWREQMMRPEENTQKVRTASVDQVRSKISTKSIGGWREVADHIQPMLDGFDPELWPEYNLR